MKRSMMRMKGKIDAISLICKSTKLSKAGAIVKRKLPGYEITGTKVPVR